MTIKKAIKILDWWIKHKKQSTQKLKQEWDYDANKITELAKALIESEEIAINNLERIKKELIPKCTHPKKMQDTCAGVKYCMSCNWDL